MKSSADLKNSTIVAIFHFAKNLDAYKGQGVPNQVQKEMIALFIEINKLIGYLSLSQQDINQIKNITKPKLGYEEYKKLKRILELHYKNNSDLNTIAMDIGENITYTNRLLQHGIDYILDNLKIKDFKNNKPNKTIVTSIPGKQSSSIPQKRKQITRKKGGFFSFLFNMVLLTALFYGGKYIYDNYLNNHAGSVQQLVAEYGSYTNLSKIAKPSNNYKLRMDGPTYIIQTVDELEPRLKNIMPKLALDLKDGTSTNAIRKLIDGEIDVAASSRMPTVEERKRAARLGKVLADHKIAMDAVVVLVNSKNPVEGVSLDDLRKIFGGYARWSDFGWAGNFAKVDKYSGPPEGGTYSFFKDRVMYSEPLAEDVVAIVGPEASSGMRSMLRMVENNPNAITFIGAGDVMSFKTIRVLKLSAALDDRLISPMAGEELNSTVLRRGEYPLTRYVYLVTAGDITQPVARLIDTVRSEEAASILAKHGLLGI